MSRPPKEDLAAEPYRELEAYLATEGYHDLGKGMFKDLVKKAVDKAAEKVHHMASGTPKEVTATVSQIRHLCLDVEKSIQRDVNAGHYDIVFVKKAALDRLFAQLHAQAQAPVQAHYASSYHPRPPLAPRRLAQHTRIFNEFS